MRVKRFISLGGSDFGEFFITDHEVADMLRKHLRFRDRFNMDKIVSAALLGFAAKEWHNTDRFGIPEGNWKFKFVDGYVEIPEAKI